ARSARRTRPRLRRPPGDRPVVEREAERPRLLRDVPREAGFPRRSARPDRPDKAAPVAKGLARRHPEVAVALAPGRRDAMEPLVQRICDAGIVAIMRRT